MTGITLTPLEVSILDEGGDFPVPLWELIQPTRWVFTDTKEEAIEGPPDRELVHRAVLSLLEKGLMKVVRVDPDGSEHPVPRPDWPHLLNHPDNWVPALRSPINIVITPKGETVLNAVFATHKTPESTTD